MKKLKILNSRGSPNLASGIQKTKQNEKQEITMSAETLL